MKEWREKISKALAGVLPAEEAHGRMMNYKRTTAAQVLAEGVEHRMSAVLILIYPKEDEPHFLLLKRHDYEGHHSGQVGLPGGKMEEADLDSMAAALRECAEESGVVVGRENVIGQLSDIYIPPSRFMVHPFVAAIDDEPLFHFDPHEVRFGIEVPLSDLLDRESVKDSEVVSSKYGVLKVKGFLFDDEVVWGATSMILMELKMLMEEVSD